MVLLQVESNLRPIQKKKSIEQEVSISNTYSKRYNSKNKAFSHEISALKMSSPLSDNVDKSVQNIIESNPSSSKNKRTSNNYSGQYNQSNGILWQNIPSQSVKPTSPQSGTGDIQRQISNHQDSNHHDRNATTIVHNYHNPPHVHAHHWRVFSDSANGNGGGTGNQDLQDLVVGDNDHSQNLSLFANASQDVPRNIIPHIQYESNDMKQEEEPPDTNDLSITDDEFNKHINNNNNNNNNQQSSNRNNKNVEMISNPSKKNTMASTANTVNTVNSKNTTYAASAKNDKNTFAYNFDHNLNNNNNNNNNNNQRLIDFEDEDMNYENDAILLGNNMNGNDHLNTNDNEMEEDLRDQAMSVASTNSEALFQQQLYNHIKGENTFQTVV